MVANTDQRERLLDLSDQAIRLVRDGKRTKEQTDELLNALQKFKNEHSPKAGYPGRFGNRCKRCGGFIDEGGFCNCQTDHNVNPN